MPSLWKKTHLLIFILLLALILRFYHLSLVPPSPSLDEVSIGYNAYSILQTGADEYGTKFPLLLRAYDDWRPALYVYTVIPFVAILGLNVLAVRLPSLIFSLLTVYLTYLLVKEIFLIDSENKSKTWTTSTPLLSSLLLAISPWHIYLSRLGHEVNLGLMLVVLGVYWFIKYVNCRKKNHFLTFSAIAFSLSFYSYQSQKIVIPVMLLFLGLIFYRRLLLDRKRLWLALAVGLLLTIPILTVSLTPQALIRFRGTSAFSNNPAYLEGLQNLTTARTQNNILAQIYYNRRMITLRIFINNYLLHFSPKWLFLGDRQEAHKVPYLGLLYPWEGLLVLLGLLYLVRMKLSHNFKLLLVIWLLTAPLAASITTQAPHAMRASTFLPVWQILEAVGISYAVINLPSWGQKITSGILVLTTILSLGYFYHQYFKVFPKEQSDSFQYALGQAIYYVLGQQDRFGRIVFSNEKQLYESYMFYLFFSKFDPKAYQKLGGTKSGGYDITHVIGKYEFRPILWNNERPDKKTLYVGNSNDFPIDRVSMYKVKNLNSEEVIRIVSD